MNTKLCVKPNFVLKWDNAPANYGAFFDGSEVRLRFYFAVGRYPLALVVRNSNEATQMHFDERG